MRWNEEREETLKRLWRDGIATDECAARLNTTRGAICGKVHRLGLNAGAATPRQIVRKSRANPHAPRPFRRAKGPKPPTEEQRQWANGGKPPEGPNCTALPPPKAHPFDKARKALADLEPHECHWPVGDPGAEGFGFCALKKERQTTRYCDHHERRAYQKRGGDAENA